MGSLIKVIAFYSCITAVSLASAEDKKADIIKIKSLGVKTAKALENGDKKSFERLFISYEKYMELENQKKDDSFSLKLYEQKKSIFTRDFEIYKQVKLSPFSRKGYTWDVRVAQIVYEGSEVVSVLYAVLPSSSNGVYSVNSENVIWAIRTGGIEREEKEFKYANRMQIAIGKYGKKGLSQKFTSKFDGSCEMLQLNFKKISR